MSKYGKYSPSSESEEFIIKKKTPLAKKTTQKKVVSSAKTKKIISSSDSEEEVKKGVSPVKATKPSNKKPSNKKVVSSSESKPPTGKPVISSKKIIISPSSDSEPPKSVRKPVISSKKIIISSSSESESPKPVKKATLSPSKEKVTKSAKKVISSTDEDKKDSSSEIPIHIQNKKKSPSKGAKIPHSFKKKDSPDDSIKINNGELPSIPVSKVEEKSYFEIIKEAIFSIDLATVKSFVKTLKGEVNLYPLIKGNLRDAGLVISGKFEDLVNAPNDPIISNISMGFLEDFIPKFKILLVNLTRIGGPELASNLLNVMGFTETKLLRLFKIGKDAKDQAKIISKMLIQISNPLGWAFIISNIVKSGYDIYKYFDNGGIVAKLGMVKKSEGLEDKFRKWSDRVLRTTLSAMLDDLTSIIEEDDKRDTSNKILKMLILGTNNTSAPVEKKKEEVSKSYLEPLLVKVRLITKPINKQIGNVMGEVSAQSMDYLVSKKFNIKAKTLFTDEDLRLLDKEDNDIEDEESVRWALQNVGKLSSVTITHLLASFIIYQYNLKYDPNDLISGEVSTSYIASGVKKVFNLFK
jgi:hypothetical protein